MKLRKFLKTNINTFSEIKGIYVYTISLQGELECIGKYENFARLYKEVDKKCKIIKWRVLENNVFEIWIS